MSNTWYGSVNNRIMEHSKGLVPEVGMGVTEYLWSDRQPWEVVEVIDERHIIVRRLDSKLPEGDSIFGSQNWIFSSNTDNACIKLFKTQKNGWRERIRNRELGCNRFVVGYADKYIDPSF